MYLYERPDFLLNRMKTCVFCLILSIKSVKFILSGVKCVICIIYFV